MVLVWVRAGEVVRVHKGVTVASWLVQHAGAAAGVVWRPLP